MLSKREPAPPIAIIGMGIRLPGGVSSAEQFWDLLVNKRDGRCRVPADRYNVDAFYSDKTHQQNTSTDHGYFLDTNIKGFDTSVFGVKRTEIGITDPQLRILLEVVWECMENAGQTNMRGTDTGVFVGVFGEDWHNMLHKDTLMPNNYRVLSAGDYALANMLSWEFDLSGPSMTLRTACSSSLSALHIACQSLYNGDCPTAIVAGSSLIMDPSMTVDMSAAGVLSPTGSCKTFDAAADGFARGEAVNAILLKPLEDAIRDGDPVRAVIRSTAVNSDGRTSHIGSPSSESQIKMIKKAYERAGIDDLSQTPFIECHGTGTVRGDPIEASAVASAFGKRGTYIGSVKPNVGHGEGAAALTSIIKATLSLETETIPPNINFTTPNPNIPFEEFNLQVPVEPIPWPRDRSARISVSSFGIGGANGHVIIDSAASFGVGKRPPNCHVARNFTAAVPPEIMSSQNREEESSDSNSLQSSCTTLSRESHEESHDEEARWVKVTAASENCPSMPYLVPVSAGSVAGLKSRVEALKQYTEKNPKALANVAYTLSQRRIHLKHRTFCIAAKDEIVNLDVATFGVAASSDERRIAFVFTGQGAQWPGMGKSLMESSPAFLNDIKRMDHALQRLDKPPTWSIEEELLNGQDLAENLTVAEFAQPLCTAIQIAVVNFLAKSGITPSAVIGHSSGEIAAAYAAGALTMDEAIICAYFRGAVIKGVTRIGAMAAIGMSKADVSPLLGEGVVVACENSPRSVTISGDADAVDETLKAIEAQDADIFKRKLRVNTAYHSDHMKEFGSDYEKLLSPHLPPRDPHVPFYSTVSGARLSSANVLDGKYWRDNLESPVLFYRGMKQLIQEMPDVSTIVEVGPHTALQGPIREINQSQKSRQTPSEYVATLVRNKSCVGSILSCIGNLFVKGHFVDFSSLCPKASLLTDLPPYEWEKTEDVWRESRLSFAWRQRQHPHHELLGSKCVETIEFEPMWRNILHRHDVSWLVDHKVGSDVVFPVAGFVAMMGEAIRQFTGCSSYKLRHVMVKAALLIPDTEPVELLTSLRPHRVTGLSNSPTWYDISISTFDGAVWVENCIAQGKAAEDQPPGSAREIVPLPRKIQKRYFYDRMQYIGLKYGTSFQGLEDISCHPEACIATATLPIDVTTYEACYTIHPTVLDCCIQLCVVAQVHGIARNIDNLVLPVMFDSITVRAPGSSLIVEANIDSKQKMGNVLAVSQDTKLSCVEIENGRCLPFNIGEHTHSKDVKHACRVQWLPNIECSSQKGLIVLEKGNRDMYVGSERPSLVTILQMIDILEAAKIHPTDHFVKYLSWLQAQKAMILSGKCSALVPEVVDWAVMSFEERKAVLRTLLSDLESVGDSQLVNVASTISQLAEPDVLLPIFDQSKTALEFLLSNNTLRDVYDISMRGTSADRFLYLCGHVNPGMRVLEIGGGTAAATEKVLSSLVSQSGVRMYSQYFFTDVSSGFFGPAKERLAGFEAIEYKVLDVENSLEQQGFELGSFDLIIASNVLHATSSLQRSLKNVRSLLRPGGRLYLHELLQPSQYTFVNLMMGLLPGWWIGSNDGRCDAPFISAERWDAELREAGFSGNDDVTLDDEPPYQLCGHIITTALGPSPEQRKTVFIYHTFRHPFAIELADSLETRGEQVEWMQLSDEIECPEAAHIISTVDLEGPYLAGISKKDFDSLLRFLQQLKDGLLWLTRAAQIGCNHPEYGIGLGLFRTIRNELSTQLWTLELDELNEVSISGAISVFEKFRLRPSDDTARRLDTEYISQQGVILVGRYHWISTQDELISRHSSSCKQVVVDQYGIINSMHWIEQPTSDVRGDEVEVQIYSVGLNFRDVMVAMGIVVDTKDSLGLEASGVVTRTGKEVNNIKVGDRVAMLASGLLSTHKVVCARQVMPIPQHLSFEEAATIPVVYATATYAIMHLGQLTKDQSVLIHSGAGGVGQAAIRICHLIGATIYTTVGSEEKVEHIVSNFGVPRERIFDSRSDSFLSGIMAATNGRGVDLVLNSLSGELFHASWECVAKHGKMMEIGKRDMIEHGRLDLSRFQGNRTLYGIDVGDLWQNTPEKLMRLVSTIISMTNAGKLDPIRPIHSFSMNDVSEAFRFMKKGQHIGKIVLNVPEDPVTIAAAAPFEPNLLSPTSAYLLIGGLGGLGKEVCRWMIEKGARRFCFLSRNAGTTKDDENFFAELETLGCSAIAVAGSVANMRDVERAISTCGAPIAGVLQMSMVLKDCALPNMDYESWRTVQDPKVLGTWNLHNALLNTKLDFFILISSVCGLAGQPGQANYASANSFLDSFMQYRHGLNLPCSVVDLGAVEGIGFLTTRPDKMNQYKSSGLYLLQEEQVMESIRIAIQRSSPADGLKPMGLRGGLTAMSQIALGLGARKALSDPRTSLIFTMDTRFRMYPNMDCTGQMDTESRDEELHMLLREVEEDPSVLNQPDTLGRVSWEIGRTLFKSLALPEENLDIHASLESIGVDSLVSIEIRNWYRRTIGLEITVLEILKAGTIEGLGRKAISSLKEKYKVKNIGEGEDAGNVERAASDEHNEQHY